MGELRSGRGDTARLVEGPALGLSVRGAAPLALLVLGSLLSVAPGARAQAIPEEARQAFAEALESLDLGRHAQAVPLLRRAIELEPRESEARVFLSGVFSRPYLPHLYLGSALASVDGDPEAGEDPCTEALKHLRISRQQGVARTFERLFAQLEEDERRCVDRLLPATEALAREQLLRAEIAAGSLDGVPPTAEHRRALVELDGVRGSLETAAAGEQLDGLESAAERAAAVAATLELLASRSSASPSEANEAFRSGSNPLSEARSAAARTVTRAEAEERRLLELLADPAHADARRTLPEMGRATAERRTLGGLRARLDAASTAEELASIEAEAETVTRQLAAISTETRRAFESHASRATPRAASPESRIRALEPAEGAPSSVGPAATAATTRLRQLASEAEGLLRRLERTAPEEPGGLYELQVRRLGELRFQARELLARTSAGPNEASVLSDRITASVDALRLVAAARALFEGDPRTTLDLLGVASTAGDESPLAPQRLLLRAAAHHQLYRLGGELDPDQRRHAVEAVRASRNLAPQLNPDPTHFSPTFRTFYQSPPSEPSRRSE